MIYPDGRSVKWYKRTRVIKIVLFAVMSIITALIFLAVHRPKKIVDFSNGVFSETFQTTHRPLQLELVKLYEESFFLKNNQSGIVPESLRLWYSSPETSKVLSGRSFALKEYHSLIQKSLQTACREKKLYFSDPMENPVPGDLFQTLFQCYTRYLMSKNYRGCVTVLENMFCYSSLILNSNAADTYFLAQSVKAGKLYESSFAGNPRAMEAWRIVKDSLSGKYLYPMHGIYQLERLRGLNDFERIRRYGIRMFDGKPSGWALIQDGIAVFSFSRIREGFSTIINDFFYDADRDQTLCLSMLRKLLYEGIDPSMMSRPDRKMSIRCYRRISNDAEVLSSALDYLEKRTE